MTAFLLAVAGLGVAGLDPAGALIVVAALAAGARRRAVVAFAVTTLVVTVAMGVSLSALLGPRLAAIDWSVLDLPDPMWIVLDLGLAAILLVWSIRRGRRRDAPAAAPTAPPARRATSTVGLAGMGVLFGLSAALDPTFIAVVVLAGRGEPLWWIVVAHLLWVLLSQAPLFALATATLANRHERAVVWFQGRWARARPAVNTIITVLLAVAGVYFLADAIAYLATGAFLIG